MAMTVKLYKDSKIDGITRLGLWPDKATQTAYFDTLTSKTYNVNTVGLGTPLRINDKLNNLLGYGYGHIDYGDGFRYYFAVADLLFVTETITDVSYTLDCYDTAITQTDIKLARATVTRAPYTTAINTYPYSPPAYHYSYKALGNSSRVCYLAVVNCRDDSGNNSAQYLAYISDNLKAIDFRSFIGNVKTAFDFPYTFEAGDIYNLTVSPIYPDFASNTYCQEVAKTEGTSANWHLYICNSDTITQAITTVRLTGKLHTTDIIRDCRGNEIFSMNPNAVANITSLSVCFSASSIMLYLNGTIYQTTLADTLQIPFPTEILDVYSDAYKEYYYRQRAIDIEARNLQINQSLYANLLGSGTSGISGAIGGGMAGVGAGTGAIAGVAIGVASSVGNYAIESYYSPKQQSLVDTSYRNLSQTLKISGNAVSLWFDAKEYGVWSKTFNSEFLYEYNNDVTENGNYIQEVTDDFGAKLETGPFTADVEVLGDIPISWKEQIHARFASGVKIV